MMIFVWILVGFCIYYFLKNRDGGKHTTRHSNGPEEQLKQRYVNGEIDEVTYTQMLKTIRD